MAGFAEFLQLEIAGAVVLLGATILALVLANTSAHVWLDAASNANLASFDSQVVELYANTPLSPNETFTVRLEGTAGGQPFTLQWAFTTGN